MLVNQMFLEAKSKFNEIQKLCLQKCMVITVYKKKRIEFFYGVIKCCHRILKNVEEQNVFVEDETYSELEGKMFLDKMCQDAYVSARQKKIIDYPFYYQKNKLLEWEEGKNPYSELQNIGKQKEFPSLDVKHILFMFNELIKILKEDSDLLEIILALKRVFSTYGVRVTEEQ